MDIFLVVAILLLIGSALLLILYPLWQQTRPQTTRQIPQAGQTLDEVEARYQATLDSIRELMFDYQLGKVSDQDYETLLTNSKFEAAKIRRQLDRLSSCVPAGHIDANLDAKIEAMIAETRQNSSGDYKTLLTEVEAEIERLKNIKFDAPSPSCSNCGHVLSLGDAFCARCGTAVKAKISPNTCPQCGYTHHLDDAFCAKCGAALKESITERSIEDAKR
jgi:hypothetical protein